MIKDAYFDRLRDALEEVRRRRTDPEAGDMITRFEESPYGGYRVRSMPADFLIDSMVDGIQPPHSRYKIPA